MSLTANKLKGVFTALVTPFQPQTLKVDEAKLRALVNSQIKAGVAGLVVVGTTGESATLSHAEHEKIIKIVVEETDKRVIVIAGAGSNNTKESVSLARHAKKVQADAILVVAPYYNKPTQTGLIAHYQEIAKVGIPMVLYNVPSRTGCNLTAETTLTLAQNPNIIAIKEASGDLKQIKAICRQKPQDFAVLSGEDSQTLQIIRAGGSGVVSVVANQIPQELSKMLQLALKGKTELAQTINRKFQKLMRLNFVDNNPTDVKFALAQMGKIDFVVRLPLVAPAPRNQKLIQQELAKLGLAKPAK